MTQAILAAHSYSTRAIELFIELFRSFLRHRRNQAAIKQTIKELNMLTDRELNDIGMCRGDIRSVARKDADMLQSQSVSYNENMKGWV